MVAKLNIRGGCEPLKMKQRTCLFCCKIFRDYPALQLHINKHTGERPYQCSKCDLNYSDLRYLSSHRDSVHLKIRYKCVDCQKYYYCRANLRRHRNQGYCTAEATSEVVVKGSNTARANTKLKISIMEQQRKVKVKQVERLQKAKEMAADGLKKKSNSNSFQPEGVPTSHKDVVSHQMPKRQPSERISARKFLKSKQIVVAPTKVTPPTTPIPDFNKNVDILKASNGNVAAHPMTITKVEIDGRQCFECPVCHRRSNDRSNMLRHYKAAHLKIKFTKPTMYKCNKCNATFPTFKLLWSHKKTSHAMKLHDCTFCSKQFTDHSNMLRHRKIHTQNQPQIKNPAAIRKTLESVENKNYYSGCPKSRDDSKFLHPVPGQTSSLHCKLLDLQTTLLRAVEIGKERNASGAAFFLHLGRYDPTK